MLNVGIQRQVKVGHHHHVHGAKVARGHDVGNEAGIGNGDNIVVQRLQPHRTQGDGDDLAVHPIKADPVAHMKRPIKQQDQAGYQRRGNILQGKAHRHRRRAADGQQKLLRRLQHTYHQRGATDDVQGKAQ